MSYFLPCLILSFLLTGCAIGPKITNTYIPPLDKTYATKKIIVSNFLQTNHESSVTRSAQISTTLEYIHANDISFQIANYLKSLGLNAEAKKGPKMKI